MSATRPPGCLGAILHVLSQLFGNFLSGSTVPPSDNRPTYPFTARERLLTYNEQRFYAVLVAIASKNYHVFASVRLIDVVQVIPGTQSPQGFRNKIDRKQIDFLLCDKATYKPLIAIELDDSSHALRHRKRRDEELNKIMAAARIPLLHILTAKTYDPEEVVAKIKHCYQARSEDDETDTLPHTP